MLGEVRRPDADSDARWYDSAEEHSMVQEVLDRSCHRRDRRACWCQAPVL
jgi:hypothetical protein